MEVIVSPYLLGCDLDKLKRYRDAGADQVVLVAFASDFDQMKTTVEGLAEELVEPAQSL